MKSAKVDGEAKLQKFLNRRLKTQEVDLNAVIKTSKSKTSATLRSKGRQTTKPSLNCSGRHFDRLLVISQQRCIDLKKVMSYSLGEVSWSLSNADGTLLKTAKSTLMSAIESDLSADCYVKVKELTDVSCIIVDGMAKIQAMKPQETFGQLAYALLKRVSAMAAHCKCARIDLICDTYPALSINEGERERQGTRGRQLLTLFGAAQRVPLKYAEFLAEGSNKEALAELLFKE